MISAVIFDMDGLLLDSEVYWERARREYCASLSCDWSRDDELSVKGNNSREWAARILDRCGLTLRREQVIVGVSARMEALYRQHLPLLPGATSVVRALAGEYPLGLASSSPPPIIEYALQAAGIRECFSVIVSADEVGKGKPAPDVFLATAARLGVAPNHTAVFEDSSAGIMAARAAGMRVIAVPNPHFPPSPEALDAADVVLSSLPEFHAEVLRRIAE